MCNYTVGDLVKRGDIVGIIVEIRSIKDLWPIDQDVKVLWLGGIIKNYAYYYRSNEIMKMKKNLEQAEYE